MMIFRPSNGIDQPLCSFHALRAFLFQFRGVQFRFPGELLFQFEPPFQLRCELLNEFLLQFGD